MAEYFNTWGVSIPFINKFVILDTRFRDSMTTSEVSDVIVKPDTAYHPHMLSPTPPAHLLHVFNGRTTCSFIDLFKEENGDWKCDETGRPYVAPATCFLSQARAYRFRENFDVMRNEDQDDYF